MRKRPLLWTACVFLTGLAYKRYAVEILLLIPFFLLVQEIVIAVKYKTWKKYAGRSILLLFVFLFGYGHMQKEEAFREAYLSKLEDGNYVTVWGEIKTINTTEYGVRCIITDCYIRIHEEENSWKEGTAYTESAGRLPCNDIMVYTSSSHYQVGQIHEITGQFKQFSTARNQGDFDSLVFYQSQKIDFIVEEESSRVMGVSQSWIEKALLELRDNLKQVYLSEMPEDAAGFYIGMLLGDKSYLSPVTKELFVIGGISHILAISGLHISIIGRRLYIYLRKLRMSFRTAGVIAGGVLLMYTYMVGGSMSTLRAVGMMLLYFLAQYWGRSYDLLNALGGICLVLLWENPFLLEYSGFWFSVLALLGIAYVGPVLARDIRSSNKRKVTESFWTSMGITLCTLPVVAYSYYEIPMYSSIVNMIALPLLTPVFVLAILGGIVGLWASGIASVLFLPCQWLFGFYEWLCSFIRTLPGASIICGELTPLMAGIYYLVLLTGIWLLQRISNRKEKEGENIANGIWNSSRTIGVVGVCVLCFSIVLYPKAKPFEITFLDVGQGDGVYISMGDGVTCFIDGGSSSVNEVGQYRILPFLKSKDVASIDYWFVTHADTDHISGLLEILVSGYKVSHLVLADAAPKDENYMELVTVAEQYGAEIIYMKAGDQLETSGVRLSCLYPAVAIQNVDRNEASLVLELEVSGDEGVFQALFTGDISEEVEVALSEQGILSDVDLYKAAHHGSKYSNSTALLEIIKPEIAVISCSEHNLYGHPAPEAVARIENCGATVYYTMESGQITVNEVGDIEVFLYKFPEFLK